MKIKTFFIICFALIELFALHTSVAEARSYRSSPSDVYVRGYFRKDGTYVSPHYRSSPDGYTWNNYSCIDNGQCGSTYTSRNYSVGTYNYNTNSYQPISTPIPAHSSKVTPPANAKLNLFGDDWICDSGYKRNYQTNQCDKIECPSNSYESFGFCLCNSGYQKNYSSGLCEPCPENSTGQYGACSCNQGYVKNTLTGQCDRL